MEQPYRGRAVINDNFDTLEIVIPAKKNWFVIVFLSAWLCGWLAGELAVTGVLTGFIKGGNFVGFFLLFWFAGWTAGGFFAIRTLTWMVAGKEVITAGKGALSIARRGDLLSKPKTYDLLEVKNIRVLDDPNSYSNFFGARNDLSLFSSKGTIRFDYGMKTIKFAAGVDESEANYILNRLVEKNIIARQPAGL